MASPVEVDALLNPVHVGLLRIQRVLPHSQGVSYPVEQLHAYLADRHTIATLRDLAAPFGLNHPDSVSNLIRRAEKHLAQSRQGRDLAARIVETITKTENRV
jgi:hypothetical protein